ncbi:MAG TPA: adenylyltransferase/cytidyltransferase family protein [Candidatus Tumulicola sp.]|jgi:rfaE bifunctional protein nucleotidyltransferase chain/domain
MVDSRIPGLLDAQAARGWREALRERGKTVVFTNGCFDVLHAGHVGYLAWARTQGDALIVGLNDDESVRGLKGPARPVVPFEERAEILLGLRSVDAVVGFSQSTPEELLEIVRPDVHVKSDQYREEELPERTVVLQHGGRIVLAPHRWGTSTTDTIARILRKFSPTLP